MLGRMRFPPSRRRRQSFGQSSGAKTCSISSIPRPTSAGRTSISRRYIRDGDDTDVQLYWRELAGGPPDMRKSRGRANEELCRVSLGDARKFFKAATGQVFAWDPLREEWTKPQKPRAGAVYLVNASAGGYDDEEGWTGDSKSKVTPRDLGTHKPEGYPKDPKPSVTESSRWLRIPPKS